MSPGGLLVAAVVSQAQPAQPVFGISAEVVRIEALATRGGRIVRGLTPADFEIVDDGVRQEVRSVSLQEVPVDLVLVLDMSSSVRGAKLTALRTAATTLLDGLASGDRAALVTFGEWTRLAQGFTDDPSRVHEALGRARDAGATALRDAVFTALHLWDSNEHRRAAVIFSDGADNLSWLEADSVVESAAWSDATVYGVTAESDEEPGHAFLRDLARATGGRTWRAREGDELRDRFLDVLEDIRSRYVLSYAPVGVDAEGWHDVEVRVRGRSIDVLARPGYYRPAPSPTPTSR